jgi:hypothetical protein
MEPTEGEITTLISCGNFAAISLATFWARCGYCSTSEGWM